MHLAAQQQRIDDLARVVHRNMADQVDEPGIGVDFNLREMRAVRPVGPGFRCPRAFGFQSQTKVAWPAHRHVGHRHHVADMDRFIGAGDRQVAFAELDILLGHFQHMGGDLLRLFDDFVGGVLQCRAANRHRARTIGTATISDGVGIALDQADFLERDAEP